MALKIKKEEKLVSIDIPKEMAVEQNVTGCEISTYDPRFAKKMEIARRGMRKYRNALAELAK